MVRDVRVCVEMTSDTLYERKFDIHGGDFDKAGEVSTSIKGVLKATGIDSTIIRRVSIACFEAEINVVIHAESGFLDMIITPESILIAIEDK